MLINKQELGHVLVAQLCGIVPSLTNVYGGAAQRALLNHEHAVIAESFVPTADRFNSPFLHGLIPTITSQTFTLQARTPCTSLATEQYHIVVRIYVVI